MCDKHTHENQEKKDRFMEHCCRGGRMERFLEPCLLLLLCQEPAHGYELIQKLCDFGFEPETQDPGHIYRHLRRMEKEGMVTSRWETSESGPARRLYQVTGEGNDLLEAWSKTIQGNIEILQRFLQRYDSLQ